MRKEIIAAITAAAATLSMSAATPGDVMMRGYRVSQGSNTPAAVKSIGLEIDSISFRKDLTRVYGKITGPHNRSAQIDKIELRSGTNKYESNDIDGFDYQRAFQWEEDGSIPVEIDFPAIASRPSLFTIIAATPKGTCMWSVAKRR